MAHQEKKVKRLSLMVTSLENEELNSQELLSMFVHSSMRNSDLLRAAVQRECHRASSFTLIHFASCSQIRSSLKWSNCLLVKHLKHEAGSKHHKTNLCRSFLTYISHFYQVEESERQSFKQAMKTCNFFKKYHAEQHVAGCRHHAREWFWHKLNNLQQKFKSQIRDWSQTTKRQNSRKQGIQASQQTTKQRLKVRSAQAPQLHTDQNGGFQNETQTDIVHKQMHMHTENITNGSSQNETDVGSANFILDPALLVLVGIGLLIVALVRMTTSVIGKACSCRSSKHEHEFARAYQVMPETKTSRYQV